MKTLTPVEHIKANSRGLRGTIQQSLSAPLSGGLLADDQQLLRLHGSYQQDDRDVREARRLTKLEPLHRFMVRVRLPGGELSSTQLLKLIELAHLYGQGALRLTTRQTFQFHGIVKNELKSTMQGLQQGLMDSIATCGDVNRNVMATSAAIDTPAETEVLALANKLSQHCLPKTRAYHEIWLDGEALDGPVEEEPLYGKTYLPRKFKTAFAIPPYNDTDIYTQDLGFVAIIEQHQLVGFNLLIGGGMGSTHRDQTTYPRLADVVGFFPKEQLLDFAEAVIKVQRDLGNRTSRPHARFKYTIEEHGLARVVTAIEKYANASLQPARPAELLYQGDRFGWVQTTDQRWRRILRFPAGRLKNTPELALLDGLAALAQLQKAVFRCTPNQNLMIAGISTADKSQFDELINQYQLDQFERQSPLKRDALACVALPTCPLAMAEAERYLPALTTLVDRLMDELDLGNQPLSLRITGCPNGCARPHVAEIALIGKAMGRYNLYVGGNAAGSRLAELVKENIDEAQIINSLRDMLGRYSAERVNAERFGDFYHRVLRDVRE